MTQEEFKHFRKRLNRTQKEMAQLLGTSIKAIHSYEQGWRTVPVAVERQIYFLIAHLPENHNGRKACWTIKKCPARVKRQCPAWEFKAGKLCWFINGTLCEAEPQHNWQEKIATCRACEAFIPHL